MKKIFYATLFSLGMFSCANNDSDNERLAANQPDELIEKRCLSHEIHQQQLAANPELAQKMEEIERFTQRVMQDRTLLADGTMEIPVVFNVLYRTATENISDAQLQSQIDVLNEDFGATNADYGTATPFDAVKAGDTKIRFKIDAINRQSSTKRNWRADDSMKSSASGGINATSPTTKLNIWIVNQMVQGGKTILGYAQFPGGPASTDGVVLAHNFTGRTGTVAAPYNKGRTATHEVGHWLNLRHIWGDVTCGTDLVADTPTHNASNGGCPASTHRSTCTGTPLEMTMNYMDYTADACMYMFSAGQKTRMQATYAVGGPRASFR
jgi:hypothetical protein